MSESTESIPVAFDPAQYGTPESNWTAALLDAPSLALSCSAVVVVSPHPDDEAFGAGGLICSAARAGHTVTVLSVTDGEAAYPDWRGLDGIRRRELDAALGALAPRNVAAERLSLPDGKVDGHRLSLFDSIDRHVSHDTLLVAPYERDGHPDHDATGEVCRDIARARKAALWRYPIWLWHHGSPRKFAGKSFGRFELDAPARQAKARAISCFASQLRPLGRKPIVPAHVLSYFSRAYEIYLT